MSSLMTLDIYRLMKSWTRLTLSTNTPLRSVAHRRLGAKRKALKNTGPEAAREYATLQAVRVKAWKDAKPDAVREHEKRRKNNDYHRPFVAIDAEGMDIPGNDISRKHNVI